MISKKINKPWGHYTDYYRSKDIVCKQIVIEPGQSISYQYHSKRSEFWYIKSGQGLFVINGRGCTVHSGFTFVVECGMKHRIKNTGTEDLVIYEMQYGECSEDDIVRIEDQYGR